MKLHTLTLPTGEFVLVASEVPADNMPPQGFAVDLREQTGAAAMIAIDQTVEIENAFIEADAKRAERPVDLDLSGLAFGEERIKPVLVEAGISNRTADIIARIAYEQFGTPPDDATGRELPRRQYAWDLESEETRGAWRGWALERAKEITDGVAPKPDVVGTAARIRQYLPDPEKPEAYLFKVGDRVRVTGHEHLDGDECRYSGVEGTVKSFEAGERDYVWIDADGKRLNFRTDELELVRDEEEPELCAMGPLAEAAL